MIKYRVVVNAGKTWKSSYGDEYRNVAEQCVRLEARDTEDGVRKAEDVMRIIYPEANVFDSYNAVNELEDPGEVLRFVIGWAQGKELIDSSPIVMWGLREQLPRPWSPL